MIAVACLLYEGFQLLDLAGPLAVFEVAGHQGSGDYAVTLVAEECGPVISSGGTPLTATVPFADAAFDTLLIPGGLGARNTHDHRALLPLIRRAAERGTRIVSVSSAAFILAEAGVLDGRPAITHWGAVPVLSQRYPQVAIDGQALYSRDGNIWTSAGSIASADLALALVEEDYGAAAAARIANALLLPLRRTGAHAQRSPMLVDGRPSRFNELIAWMQQRLDEDLSIERLADQAALSVRHFTRSFRKAIGTSPASYVEELRLERARGLIEGNNASFEEIARQCGFGNPDRMRRAFLRAAGNTPREMRRARKQATWPTRPFPPTDRHDVSRL